MQSETHTQYLKHFSVHLKQCEEKDRKTFFSPLHIRTESLTRRKSAADLHTHFTSEAKSESDVKKVQGSMWFHFYKS